MAKLEVKPKPLTNDEQKKLVAQIKECGEVKAQKKEITDKEKVLVNDIKKIMGEHDLDDVEAGSFVAQYRLTKSPSMDEEGLLAYILAEMGDVARQIGIVETKEYINQDALEKAIYRGDIDKELVKGFKKFEVIKRTPKLTIVARKEK